MSSSLSSAIDSGAPALNVNDQVLFWNRISAHFRDRVNKMVCRTPITFRAAKLKPNANPPADVLDINGYTIDACLRHARGRRQVAEEVRLCDSLFPSLHPLPRPATLSAANIMMNANNGNLSEQTNAENSAIIVNHLTCYLTVLSLSCYFSSAGSFD